MSTPFEQLNDADLELVSSYIDGEVTAEERTELEARLEREPALRAALDELRATTQLIRELPRMMPPRSFTIDPASARPRWAGAFGWLRFGSALAAVLLALTVTFDIIGSRGMGMTTSSAPQVMSDQSAGGAASSAATSAENSAPAAENSAPAAESGSTNANNAAGLLPMPTSAPASGASEALGATPPAKQPPSIMSQSVPDEQATAVVQSTNSGASNTMELRSAEPTTTQNQADALAMATAEAGGVAASGSSSPSTDTFEQPVAKTIPPQAPLRPLRLVEFSLAAITIVLGLAALWVARQGRR